MPVSLATLPDFDRPRERLWSLGAGALTSVELLAIVLGTGSGTQSSLEVAASLLAIADGSLRRLAARPAAELKRSPGIGPAKAARLLAAFELANRLSQEARPPSSGSGSRRTSSGSLLPAFAICKLKNSIYLRWTARARSCAIC